MQKVFTSPPDGIYFFGYYDKSPLNTGNDKLLACKATFSDRNPTAGDTLEIGYFNWMDSNEFISVATTNAWNWQQGCMLRWHPTEPGKILFNDLVDKKFKTVKLCLSSNETSVYNMASYDVSPIGDYSLCVDYERLYWFREGYNYKGLEVEDKNKAIDLEDGIWYQDLSSGAITKIISLRTLMAINPLQSMAGQTHYLEHIMINPSGDRFAFLHRWSLAEGGVHTRLFTVNPDGSNIRLLHDTGRFTHFCWYGDDRIVAWGSRPTTLTKLKKFKFFSSTLLRFLKPIYKFFVKSNSINGNNSISKMLTGDCYVEVNDKTGSVKETMAMLNKDGHPSFSVDRPGLLVTDSYPNNEFLQELKLINYQEQTVMSELNISHQPEFAATSMRSDLHPKWCVGGNYICVDTMRDNCNRAVELYQISRY